MAAVRRARHFADAEQFSLRSVLAEVAQERRESLLLPMAVPLRVALVGVVREILILGHRIRMLPLPVLIVKQELLEGIFLGTYGLDIK